MDVMHARRRKDAAAARTGVVLTALAGILFLVVVLLSATSCSRGGSSKTGGAEQDDIALAKIAGKKFTVGDLKKKVKYQYRSLGDVSGAGGVEQQRQILRDAIDQLAMVALAEKRGYSKEPEFKETWELSRRYILAERTMQHEVRDKEAPADDEIRRYYDEHVGEFLMPTRVQLAHVVVASRAEALAVRAKLLRGEPVGDLARQVSIDEPTKTTGGVLGWVTQTSGVGHLGMLPQVNAVAMALHPGEVSDPVQIPSGWTVLYALDRTEAGARPFDDAVKEAVRKKVQTKKHNELYKKMVESLRKEFGVEVYDENFEKYARSMLSEEDLFAAAQREKDPAKRLGCFQDILTRFPESPHAAQAQFMVGFIQADERKDYASAREAFNAFLGRYPDHELAASARWMLENMEKPNPDPQGLQQVRRRIAGR